MADQDQTDVPADQEPTPPVAPAQDVIPPVPADVPDSGPPIDVTAPNKTAPAMVPPVVVPVDSNELKKEDQFAAGDIANGHITPHTYADLFAKKDTLGKIGTLFGIMVGSAGAGLSRQPNIVADMMKQTVQNDLDAQKSSAANAQNFVRLSQAQQLQGTQIENLKKTGMLTDAQAKAVAADSKIKADSLAHMISNRAAFHHLVQMAQSYPEGSAERVTAEKQLALISQGLDQQNSDVADQAAAKSAMAHALFGVTPTTGGQPVAGQTPTGDQDFQQNQAFLRATGKADLAQTNEAHHVPGTAGQSSIPLSDGDRDQMNSGIQFQNKLAGFINWSKAHSGDLNPADMKEGQAMGAELQGAYRQATHGGVYKEGEQNFISKLIDEDPTKFFNSVRVVPSLLALQKEHNAKMGQIYESKGLSKAPAPVPTWTEAKETKTNKDSNGRQIYPKPGGGWTYSPPTAVGAK